MPKPSPIGKPHMPIDHPLDAIPLWAFVLATLVLLLAAIEAGFRLGRYRRRIPEGEKQGSHATLVAATLGLVGFMMAFTFGMAESRFEARKHLVMDEANAIGTAFLRSQLLPDPFRAKVQDLLRAYVDARLLGAKQPDEIEGLRTAENLKKAITDSVRIQGELWSQTEAVAKIRPLAVVTSLFIQSLNDVIDLHGLRIAMGIRYRIPMVIWLSLYLLAVLSMVAVGFHGGLGSPRRSAGALLVALAFVCVMTLTVDLDRGSEGWLQVGQDPMFELRASMEPPATP